MNDLVALIGFKKNEIIKALSESIGLIVRGQNSVVVILKSSRVFNFHSEPEKDRHIFMWTICGSVSEARAFEVELRHFLSVFSDTFSERDLNIHLLQDFVAGYLKQKFYDDKSAEPVALEFILGGILELNMIRHMVFYIINHSGDSEILEQKKNNISIVGGGNNEEKRELFDNLSNLGTKKLPAKQIIKKIRPFLKKYRGDFFTSSFVIINKKASNKKKSDSRSKRQ